MKIIYGIADGALFQRGNDNTCEVVFSAEVNGKLTADFCEITEIDKNIYKMTGLPIGGPYSVTLKDSESQLKLSDLWVGDLWLLGGQSNMEGVGRLTDADREYAKAPDPAIRSYGFSDIWAPAVPRLHIYADAKQEPAVVRFWNNCLDTWSKIQHAVDDFGCEKVRCVGPGLFFAQRMKELTGVPQGVIPCGFGGASINDWKADGENTFSTASVHRIKQCGGKISGMFWYQGETDAMIGTDLDVFLKEYEKVRALMSQFCGGKLPTVQVQIAAVHAFGGDYNANERWSRLKDLQYRMDKICEDMTTVSSLDGQLEDLIHLTSDSQKRVGKRAADAMFALLHGGAKQPEVEKVTLEPDVLTPFWRNIRIKYKNTGNLRFEGVAYGYTMRDKDSDQVPGMSNMGRTWTEGDSVVIRTELPEEKLLGKELWYAWGSEAIGTLVCENGEPLPVHKIDLSEAVTK